MIESARAVITDHQAVIGLIILGAMGVGFVAERFPAAVVAVLGACAFLLLGILDAEGLFGVFSNEAPITIAALFVLSGALIRTGTIDAIAGVVVARAARHPRWTVLQLMTGAYGASAFMNNTPVVLVMIPIIQRLARTIEVSAKKLLIPLSYICVLGGTTTLIGTSTNLLVDSVARESGLAPFGIFSITPVGLIVGATGAAMLALFSRRLLPGDGEQPVVGLAEEAGYLTEVRLLPGSEYVGRPISELSLARRSAVRIAGLKRHGRFRRSGLDEVLLEPGDRLVLRLTPAELLSLRSSPHFELGITAGGSDSPQQAKGLVEATVAPSHPTIGRRLLELPFLSDLRVRIIGLSRFGKLPGPDLASARLHAIDRLLVTGPEEEIAKLYKNPNLYGVGETQAREFRRHRAPIAIGALLAVVIFSALGLVSIGVAAIIAVGVILLTRCIDPEEAWGSVDGNVLILIFGMLAVGVGLERAGSVTLLVGAVTPWLMNVPPWALLATVYLTAVLLTEIITNNAVAIILTPLVIELANTLGADPRPLVVAVMFAASASFATPIGYQTNTLVYAAGGYRFTDFLKAGIPLTLAVGTMSCVAISLVY